MEVQINSHSPFFSVIIPVYNAEKFISECLQSLLSQDFQNWEVVMVDDCSSDGSIKLIKDLSGNDPRFRLLYHNKNKGAAAARNSAINEAKGIWCCFLDSDNQMLDGYLSEAYSKVSSLNDEYGIFWTGCRRILHYKGGRIEEIDSVFSLPKDKNLSKVDFLKN